MNEKPDENPYRAPQTGRNERRSMAILWAIAILSWIPLAVLGTAALTAILFWLF
jgi:hypothetical protein